MRETLLAAAAEGAEGPPPSVRDDDLRIRDDDAEEWGRATGGGRAGGAGVDVTQKKKWKEGIAAERKGVFLYWADKALNKEV